MVMDTAFAALLDQHAPWQPLPECGGLHAWMAQDPVPLWQALEDLSGTTLPHAPMFAVAWPGAQVFARLIASGRLDVTGRQVLDLGCGSGVAGVAALAAGAATVRFCDHDALALQSARLLAARHGIQAIDTLHGDGLALHAQRGQLVLAADLFYARDQARRGAQSIARWREAGAEVVLIDSGRPHFDACGLPLRDTIEVCTPRDLDGEPTRLVNVYAERAQGRAQE